MLAKESGIPNFDLPEEVLSVLPSDPFEQLDVARKITSIALATRVSKLESESSRLRAKVNEQDDLIAELQSQIESLDATLSDTADKLAQAESQKESLLKENAALSNTVKKLNRDVSKLEVFRKTLMQSLQEEEENSQAGAPQGALNQIQGDSSKSSSPSHPVGEEDTASPPLKSSSVQSQFSEAVNSVADYGAPVEPDGVPASRHGSSQAPLLASYTSTPKLTPPGSPPSFSATVSPMSSKPASPPRRHSISFSTSRGMFDDRSSVFSSEPSSRHGSISSSSDIGSQSGRARVDGKEFFRQVRTRLSYEQFGAFLANVKELNSHKRSREETLRKADEIFGPENKDLYAIFEGLINRNVH